MAAKPNAFRGYISPTRAFLVTTLSVLVGELLSVLFGHLLVPTLGWLHETMDITFIMSMTVPALYLFFVKPMTGAIRAKAEAEDALQRNCIDLDRQVLERTRQLEELNRSLRQSEAQVSSVVENSPTGIFILQNDRVVFANQRFFAISDRPHETEPDFDPEGLIFPEDFPYLKHLLDTRTPGRLTAEDYEFRIITGSGHTRWISGRFSPVQFRGEPALLGNIQDITERFEAAVSLRESRAALQMLSSRLFTVQEEERKRVAHDLHDGIGQSLTAIKFMVERAIEGRCQNPQGYHMEVLASVVPLIQNTIEEIRRICMALRPSILDDLGVIAAINWFTREFRKTYPGIQTDLVVGFQESEIPEVLKTNIFRIIQEAMNNVAKHAKANHLLVSLEPGPGDLRLTVKDNGLGFDGLGRDPGKTGGFGLASMRERTEFHDGTLIIESAKGLGTTVSAKWPLIKVPDFEQLYYNRFAM